MEELETKPAEEPVGAASSEPDDPDAPTVEEAAKAAEPSVAEDSESLKPEAIAEDGARVEPVETAVEPTVNPAAEEQPGSEAATGFDSETATEEAASAEESAEAEALAVLEAVVYVTDEPLSVQQIAGALGKPVEHVLGLLDKLTAEYAKPQHGLMVREVAGGYKMATKPEHHEAVRTFVKNLNPPLKLSLAALETLAVIAYKQPITAPEIMEIRGVQGAGVLKTLLDRKLITTSGRKNVVGRPILYKTTKDFLVQFGLKDLNELPTLKEFEELRRLALGDAEEPVLGGEQPSPAPPAPAPEQPGPGAPEPDSPGETPDEPESPGKEPEPESPGGSTDPEPNE